MANELEKLLSSNSPQLKDIKLYWYRLSVLPADGGLNPLVLRNHINELNNFLYSNGVDFIGMNAGMSFDCDYYMSEECARKLSIICPELLKKKAIFNFTFMGTVDAASTARKFEEYARMSQAMMERISGMRLMPELN